MPRCFTWGVRTIASSGALVAVLLASTVSSVAAVPPETFPTSASGWTAPTNAVGAADDTCATTARPSASLVLTDLGLAVPNDAQIRGIVVQAHVARRNGSPMSLAIRRPNGDPSGTKILNRPSGASSCAKAAAVTVGGATDLWGLRLTAADVNASGFGVVINSGASPGIRYVDAVGVSVYYRALAPSSLSATAVSPTQVDLSWTDNSALEDSFRIERCTGYRCTNFAEVGAVAADSTSFSDTSAVEGRTHSYRVRAHDSEVDSYSETSNLVGVLLRPEAPTDFDGAAATGQRVELSWTDNSTAETGYFIERCRGAGCTNFTPLEPTARNRTSYIDRGVTPNLTYAYRVRARGLPNRFSDYAPVIEITTPA